MGTGLGPTLEFYTLLSHELQRKGLGMWHSDDGVSTPVAAAEPTRAADKPQAQVGQQGHATADGGSGQRCCAPADRLQLSTAVTLGSRAMHPFCCTYAALCRLVPCCPVLRMQPAVCNLDLPCCR